MHIPEWQPGVDYQPGTVVTYQGNVYQKLDDDDQSPPDDIPGGWKLVENTNLDQYNAIDQALGSFESRRDAHKADILAQLAADHLDPADVRAVLNAK